LDVSVQAQILNLLKELQNQFDLTYLFVSHNLDVVNYMSDRIAVMYAGKIVEIGPVDEVFNSPLVPYTEALMAAIPVPDPEFKKREAVVKGEVPSAVNPPSGCRYHPRCPFCTDECKEVEPRLVDFGKEHFATCHHPRQKRQ
jgi:oligopeptide/dipeptide ABC transporter ATP-binding protein